MNKRWIYKGEEKGTWCKAGGVEVFANRHLLVWSGSMESFEGREIEDYLPERDDLFNVCEFPELVKKVKKQGEKAFKMREGERELFLRGVKGVGKANRFTDFTAFYGNGIFIVSDYRMEEECCCCVGLEERLEGKKGEVLFPFMWAYGTKYFQDMGNSLVVEPMGSIVRVEYCMGSGKGRKNWQGYLHGMVLQYETIEDIKKRGIYL